MSPTDERSPLLPSGGSGADGARLRASWKIALFAVASVLAVVPFFVMSSASSAPNALGWLYQNPPMWLPNWGGTLSPAPNNEGAADYVLHTYCKSDELKENYGDFWLDGEKEAYVVHHNYGTQNWFAKETAIKMERDIINTVTGERGYRLNSDAVDFEFGFALRNAKTDEWIYEIGKGSEAPLFNEPCVQQYGSYFNRVRTSQPDPNNIEYVMGQCDKQCDPNYLDTANQLRVWKGEIPAAPGEVIIGQSDDARLFSLHSARWGASLRAVAQRDTVFSETEDEARFIVGIVDGYGPDKSWTYSTRFMSMIGVKVVKKANKDIALSAMDVKYLQWDRECSGIACSASVYDLSDLWYNPNSVVWLKDGKSPISVYNPLFTLGQKGDSRVEYYEMKFTDDAYLTEATLAEPGTWGSDIDARRLTLVAGAVCGQVWGAGKCHRNFHPAADETVTATATEKYWIYGALGGGNCGPHVRGLACASLVRVKVFVDDTGALKIKTVGKAKKARGFENVYDHDPLDREILSPRVPIGELYHTAPYDYDVATNSRGPIGIGGLKYVLAAEMVPSLAKSDVLAVKTSGAASLGQDAVQTNDNPLVAQNDPSAAEPVINVNIPFPRAYPHFFGHDYPGTEGCQASCEGVSVSKADCESKFYCEWYNDKCYSKVGSSACPTTEDALNAQFNAFFEPGMTDITEETLHEGEACTLECEYDSESQCTQDTMCLWTGGGCVSQFDIPCPKPQ
jgi:hypothetical protein